MKIAFFLDSPKGFGGAASLLLRQAKLMSALHDVFVIIPCDEYGMINEEGVRRCKQARIPVRILQFYTTFDFRRVDFLGALKCAKKIKHFAEVEKINFFHSVQLNIAAEIAARELKIPHLMNIYQMKPEDFKLVYGNIYPKYHLCDSQLFSTIWSHNLDIESRCIRPIAPLRQQKKKYRHKKQAFLIVMVGMVCARKNQLAGIQAVERCLDKFDVRMVIAGDVAGEYAKECRNYVLRKNLQERIRFSGFVEDIDTLLDKSDCFLCTSIDESFPTSIVEAVTYDMTVVTTPVAGVPELFINGQNGFVSADFSVESIFNSLTACFQAYESAEIVNIHANASHTWENNFSPDVIQSQIENYYCFINKNCKHVEYNLEKLEEDVTNTTLLIKNAGFEKWVRKRCLYYAFIRKHIEPGRKTYIWGAGFLGKVAYDLLNALRMDIKLEAFVDRAKQGNYCALPVIKPEDIPYTEDVNVFVSFEYKKEEAIEYLEKQGLLYNEDVWLLP